MLCCKELIECIREIAPEELAESWDNCGMQIDIGKEYCHRILICLEITKEVVEEAIEKHVDFIVTHHPLYFDSMKSIDNNKIIGNYTIELIQNGISVYSAHTSFDKVVGGNNTKLCSILNLSKTGRLSLSDMPNDYMGCIAELPKPTSLKEVGKLIEMQLILKKHEIRIVGDLNRMIKKIGICTGAGGDLIEIANAKECDLLITGDVKYHDAQKAKELGIAVIDAGHYGTEYIFSPNMAEKLEKKLGEKVEILVSEVDLNPFVFI